MFNSRKYWNDRYKNRGNSGSGSYNKLAEFKAEIINNFINDTNSNSIIDYGVGDGNQLKLINTQGRVYTGIDISPVVIDKCRIMFRDDKTKTFILDNNINNLRAELVLSCDVIYHLIEDAVFQKYIHNMFEMSTRYIIIYAKDENIDHTSHVKFRKFTEYISKNFEDWKLVCHIPQRYPQVILGKNNENTSPSDFFIYTKN
jgi:trans-aconitate methyltransferase